MRLWRKRRTEPSTCACVYRYRLIGAGVFGDSGSNACLDGYMRIETESTCKSNAAAAGIGYAVGNPMVSNSFPKGCYVDRYTNLVYFNTDAKGAGERDSQLLCMLGARPALTAASGNDAKKLQFYIKGRSMDNIRT